MYCIYTCLFDLWVLFMLVLLFHWVEFPTLAIPTIGVVCFQSLFCDFLANWGMLPSTVIFELSVPILVVSAYVVTVEFFFSALFISTLCCLPPLTCGPWSMGWEPLYHMMARPRLAPLQIGKGNWIVAKKCGQLVSGFANSIKVLLS